MPIVIQVSGLKEAIATLAPGRLERALRAAAAEIAPLALNVWRQATPYRTGRLRGTLAVQPVAEGLRFFVGRSGFYYGPKNAQLGGRITKALTQYLGSREVQAIIERHLAAAFGG